MTEVVFCGERFDITDPGHYAMADFQRLTRLAESDPETAEAVALDAASDFIAACLPEGDAPRWEAAARRGKASTKQMLTVVMEAIADRPTVQPSGSSDGQTSTGTNYAVGSSSPATERTDLAYVVDMAQRRTG